MTGRYLTNEQLDELLTLQKCIAVTAELLSPCSDLHIVDRDSLATLLDYLSRRIDVVMEGAG